MGRKRKLEAVTKWQAIFEKEEQEKKVIRPRFWEARQKSGLTQPDVAEILGVSEMTVYQWEQGTKTPRVKHLVPLARIYGVTTDYLLGL